MCSKTKVCYMANLNRAKTLLNSFATRQVYHLRAYSNSYSKMARRWWWCHKFWFKL